MPRLWTETITEHRQAVREAVMDTAAALATERGLAGLTMSRIAEEAGVGRATLYKYFSDVEAILTAWHERQISSHLDRLSEVRDARVGAVDRLRAVLAAYANISYESHLHRHTELGAFLHRGGHISRAEQQLRAMIRNLLNDAADHGEVRNDIAPDELTSYCLHSISAAAELSSKNAVGRLVEVTLAGLRPEA